MYAFSVADQVQSCQTIKITLKNEVLIHQEENQGTYELSASVNGRPTWTSQQSTAIWWVPDHNIWVIGELNVIGKPNGGIYTAYTLFGANSKWYYNKRENNTWTQIVDTNDFSIECIAGKGTNQQ